MRRKIPLFEIQWIILYFVKIQSDKKQSVKHNVIKCHYGGVTVGFILSCHIVVMCSLWFKFPTAFGFEVVVMQRRIQSLVKQLRWNVLQKSWTAFGHSLFSQNVPFEMFVKVLIMPLITFLHLVYTNIWSIIGNCFKWWTPQLLWVLPMSVY